MEDIKSAYEIAMEKVKKLGEVTDEERLRWKYVPEGEKLAASYLKQEGELATELQKYEPEAAAYVTAGASEILVRNINLPKTEIAKKTNRLAMDGIKIVKQNKVDVENVYSKIRQIFKHYAEQGEQQRQQAYERLKVDVEARLQQALQQQMGTMARARIDVERQPQFQAEWQKLLGQLNGQYLMVLDDLKKELLAIT